MSRFVWPNAAVAPRASRTRPRGRARAARRAGRPRRGAPTRAPRRPSLRDVSVSSRARRTPTASGSGCSPRGRAWGRYRNSGSRTSPSRRRSRCRRRACAKPSAGDGALHGRDDRLRALPQRAVAVVDPVGEPPHVLARRRVFRLRRQFGHRDDVAARAERATVRVEEDGTDVVALGDLVRELLPARDRLGSTALSRAGRFSVRCARPSRTSNRITRRASSDATPRRWPVPRRGSARRLLQPARHGRRRTSSTVRTARRSATSGRTSAKICGRMPRRGGLQPMPSGRPEVNAARARCRGRRG